MRERIRAAAALGLLLGTTACTPFDDAMVAIFGRSMRDQDSFDPYENTMLPPENAVSFSSGNFPVAPGEINIGHPEPTDYVVPDFGPTATIPPGSDVVQGLENPVPADEASLARGEVLFNRSCAICHSQQGIGTESPLRDVWPALQAFDLAGPVAAGYSDGYLYAMIRMGRGMMPAYGHQITHFDRWHIVNYVRQLQVQNGALSAGEGGGG